MPRTRRTAWNRKAEHLARYHGLVVEGDETEGELDEAHAWQHEDTWGGWAPVHHRVHDLPEEDVW